MRNNIRAAWLALFGLAASLLMSVAAHADSRAEIEGKTRLALDYLDSNVKDVAALVDKASGVLVFPDVVEMTFGEGGRYGEGALLVDGQAVAYYATTGAAHAARGEGDSRKAELILFMTREALIKFRNTVNWKVGVSEGVTRVQVDPAGRVKPLNKPAPVLGFTFSDKGEMESLDLQGTSINRIGR